MKRTVKVSDPEVMDGTFVLRGPRVPVQTLLGWSGVKNGLISARCENNQGAGKPNGLPRRANGPKWLKRTPPTERLARSSASEDGSGMISIDARRRRPKSDLFMAVLSFMAIGSILLMASMTAGCTIASLTATYNPAVYESSDEHPQEIYGGCKWLGAHYIFVERGASGFDLAGVFLELEQGKK